MSHDLPTGRASRTRSLSACAAALSLCVWAVVHAAGAASPPPAGGGKGGGPIAAMLADDQRLIAELARRDLATLRDYLFDKHNISPEQRSAYLAIGSVRQFTDPRLTAGQRRQLARDIAAAIDNVLATIDEPQELANLAGHLVQFGAQRDLNALEYWGENARTQKRLLPMAEAIDRVYEKAILTGRKRADEIAATMTLANQAQVAPRWEAAMSIVTTAEYSRGANMLALALSLDRDDAQRAEVARRGIRILSEFEDPAYDANIRSEARIRIAKLYIAIGDRESLALAREKLAQVAAQRDAGWWAHFDARFFDAVAELTARNLTSARQKFGALTAWMKENPPEEAAVRAAEAAVRILEFRIASAEAQLATGPAAQRAQAAAVELLQRLLSDRPDLAGIIYEQLAAFLPENPDVATLNPLMLAAMARRGEEEISKPPHVPIDRRALEQAAMAAREIVRRTGRDGFTSADAQTYMLLLAFIHTRLEQDAEAVTVYLDFLQRYRNESPHAELALDNAAALLSGLRRAKPPAAGVDELYGRFLALATAPPFSRKQYYFEYARRLIDRNTAAMQGGHTEAQVRQMLENARKAAALAREVDDQRLDVAARFLELRAYDQLLDLSDEPNQTTEWLKTTRALADELNRLIDQRMSHADAATAVNLRWYKVSTNLLAAKLADHAPDELRRQSMEHALSLLKNFEADVQGLPNAQALLGDALFLRVQYLLALGRSDEALGDLGRFVETRSGDDALRVIGDMLQALETQYRQAMRNNDEARAAELAAHRARVSGYFVQRARESTRPDLRQRLPEYRRFEAQALREAATLQKDPQQRRKFLNEALAIFQDLAASADADLRLKLDLDIAATHYELGNYAQAQPIYARLLDQRLLGPPMGDVQVGPDGIVGPPPVNDAYWGAMLRLLWCNLRLTEAGAEGFGPQVLQESKRKLDQLYIIYGEPGGPRWAPQYDELNAALKRALETRGGG